MGSIEVNSIEVNSIDKYEPTFVVAVDPGKTSGLAFWGSSPLAKHCIATEPRQRDNWLQMVEDIYGWLKTEGVGAVVVYEGFRINAGRGAKSAQPFSLEAIGAMKFCAWLCGAAVAEQRPADAKRFATDTRLRKAGMWHGAANDHANDAERHLFLWLCKHGYLSVTEVDRADG